MALPRTIGLSAIEEKRRRTPVSNRQDLRPGAKDWLGLCFLPALQILAITFSAFVLLGSVYVERGQYLSVVALGIVVITPILPRCVLGVFLALLPVFGNRPGSEQSYWLLVLSSAVTLGLSLALIIRRRTFSLPQKSPRGLQLIILYVLVSIASLTSLSLLSLWRESIARFSDFHPTTIAINLLTFVQLPETSVAYSVLSVLLTVQAAVLSYLAYRLVGADSRTLLLMCWTFLFGLVVTLIIGLCDYYGLFSIAGFRALDPVVNPAGGQFRMQSFFGHSGWFAEYITLAIPFSMLFLTLRTSYFLRVALLLVMLVVGEYCLLLSFQRGGWVSYPLTLLAIWFAVYVVRRIEKASSVGAKHEGALSLKSSIRGSILKVAISLPLTIIASLLVLSYVMQENLFSPEGHPYVAQYFERFKDISKTSDRTDFLFAGSRMALLHPFYGAGSESFGWQYEAEVLTPGGALYGTSSLALHGSAHNVFVQTLAGKGVSGLLVLLLLVTCYLWGGMRAVVHENTHRLHDRVAFLVLVCFCCAFLIYGNVQEVFYIQSLQLMFFLVLGLFTGLLFNQKPSSPPRLLMSLLLLLFAGHLIWEFAYPGAARARAVQDPYGCYGVEEDADGMPYRWCAPRALQLFRVEGESRIIRFDVETLLLTTGREFDFLSIEADGQQLLSVRLQPLRQYPVEFVVPEELSHLVDSDGQIWLKLITGSSFIPVRDMDGLPDYRVLSYKLRKD